MKRWLRSAAVLWIMPGLAAAQERVSLEAGFAGARYAVHVEKRARDQRGPASRSLIGAVRKGDIERARIALGDGADIEIADRWVPRAPGSCHGCRPLDIAVFRRDAAMAEFLIAQGADIIAVDRLNRLLEIADPDVAMLERLIAHATAKGADVKAAINLPEQKGQSTLLYRLCVLASPDQDAEAVAIAGVWLKYGADINAKNIRGFTPLHGSLLLGPKPLLVSFLIANNADWRIRNNEGETPLQLARRRVKWAVAVLQQAGVTE